MELNKRGQGLSVTTIVIIILSIIVLVFLIYGFTVGWSNLFDKVTNLGGGEGNIDTIVQACNVACATGSQFDFNSKKREVNFGDGRKFSLTCKELMTGKKRESFCMLDKKEVTFVSDTVVTDDICKGSVNFVDEKCILGDYELKDISQENCKGTVTFVVSEAFLSVSIPECENFT